MSELGPGAEPFLRERRRQELASAYEEVVAAQNDGADPELVRQTADKLADLAMPFADEVDFGGMPLLSDINRN